MIHFRLDKPLVTLCWISAVCWPLKSLEGFSPFKVVWNYADFQLCDVMGSCPFDPYGLAHGPEHITKSVRSFMTLSQSSLSSWSLARQFLPSSLYMHLKLIYTKPWRNALWRAATHCCQRPSYWDTHPSWWLERSPQHCCWCVQRCPPWARLRYPWCGRQESFGICHSQQSASQQHLVQEERFTFYHMQLQWPFNPAWLHSLSQEFQQHSLQCESHHKRRVHKTAPHSSV